VIRPSCCVLAAALGCSVWAAGPAVAGVPVLPDSARTRWVVGQPQEIVTYLTFDPARVQGRLPSRLRFITVDELAAGGIAWATDYLAAHPAHGRWGVSFLEIIRCGTFAIDGRAPHWPKNGAAALWCARVAASDTATDLGPGRPLLVLEFWVPDRAYVAYMREKGHYATYGDVRLRESSDGSWRGSVDADGLNIAAAAKPTGPIAGGSQSAGSQAFFPPRGSGVRQVVRLAFAGHRVQECGADATWRIRGNHPLAGCLVLPPTTYQFGYDLLGGAYP
jgi:hypothetical protein